MSLDALPFPQAPIAAIAEKASLRVDTIVDATAFGELRNEWSALLETSPSDCLFVTWEWLHTWWTHLRGNAKLTLITVRRGSDLIAIAPFASDGADLFGSPRLSFLGEGRVGSDYLDVVVHIFTPEKREFYRLEQLWGEVPTRVAGGSG